MYKWIVTMINGQQKIVEAQRVEVGERLVFFDASGLVIHAFTSDRWIEIEKKTHANS